MVALRFTNRFSLCRGLAMAACVVCAGGVRADDLASLGTDPLGPAEAFTAPSESRVESAASRLRDALRGLDTLLARSASGADWKRYLDWQALTGQAASATAADGPTLRRLHGLLDAEENGLEMPQFAAVRRAVLAYAEAVDAARSPEAATLYGQRLERLAAAVAAGAASGTPAALDPVGPLLARLEESGQASAAVGRIRRAVTRPNLYLDVDESLLAGAVNRVVDETAAINDDVLGTRVRGTGHTTGFVMLDFVPSPERATVDIRLDATNHSRTRGGQGPVTVHTVGTTTIDAQKRITVDDQRVTSLPVQANVSTDTRTAGISVGTPIGKRIIRKIASKKVAEMRPRAEAISEQRARERVRKQFEEQTAAVIDRAASDYQTRFRRPLMERGWYPEVLQMATSDARLSVVVRKSLADQVAAFSAPPDVDPDAILAARLHETLVNNVAEITLGGRTITQAFVEEQIRKNEGQLPESLQSDADQPPWSITFAKRKPVELDIEDDRLKCTVRGSEYTSGEREFPAMDVWAAYRVEPAPGGIRLVRDGDVQIYPPGFVPGGGEKLSVQETSLRRILQKRFNKVFKEVVDVEPLKLPGELESAGPLPMEQLVARKDGWVAVGWRRRDPNAPASQPTVASLSPRTLLDILAPALAAAE